MCAVCELRKGVWEKGRVNGSGKREGLRMVGKEGRVKGGKGEG